MNLKGNIVVIGDVMLDMYIHGDAWRLSPEAPVPVVAVSSRVATLGGAGNVAMNLIGLGCKVWLFGARGNDQLGDELVLIMSGAGIVDCLDIDPVLPTTAKTRVIANRQQLIRFDEEGLFNGYHGCYDCIISEVARVLSKEDIGAVILSDYNKGVLSRELAIQVVRHCNISGIPILVDPKGGDWLMYADATLMKPNLIELGKVLGHNLNRAGKSDIAKAASVMRKKLHVDVMLVTMGAQGMMLIDGHKEEFIPTAAKEVFDVSGAGDTVVATMAACMCSGYSVSEAAIIANRAAGIVVGKVGTSPITLKELET